MFRSGVISGFSGSSGAGVTSVSAFSVVSCAVSSVASGVSFGSASVLESSSGFSVSTFDCGIDLSGISGFHPDVAGFRIICDSRNFQKWSGKEEQFLSVLHKLFPYACLFVFLDSNVYITGTDVVCNGNAVLIVSI